MDMFTVAEIEALQERVAAECDGSYSEEKNAALTRLEDALDILAGILREERCVAANGGVRK